MTPVQYRFSGEELPSWIAGLDEEYPRPPVGPPPPVAASNRRSVLAAAAFVFAIGGADEVLPNAGGLRLEEDPGPTLVVVAELPVVQVFTEGDELPFAAAVVGLEEEGGPVLPAPAAELPAVRVFAEDDELSNLQVAEEGGPILPATDVRRPVAQVFAADDELPNAGGLRADEEPQPVLPRPHVEPPVVYVVTDEDVIVPQPTPLPVDEPAGPVLPDPEIPPLSFYSITVAHWGADEFITLARVLFPPSLVDAPPRRWKVDAEREWKASAPERRLKVDDDL